MIPRSAIQNLIRIARPYWFRGKGRLFNHLIVPDGKIDEEIYGARFNLDLSDHIQRNIYLGVYEPHETRLVRSFLGKGMTFVDVGANVGYFTALAASLVGDSGKVFAIEPSPYAFGKLSQMVKASGLDQVMLCPFGLGSEQRTFQMKMPAPGNHTPSLLSQTGESAVEVQVRTLDECILEWGIKRIDLLKIDIEGFEYRALQGAKRALEKGVIQNVLCEFNDYWLREAGTTPKALFDFILGMGFRSLSKEPEFLKGSNHNLFFRLSH